MRKIEMTIEAVSFTKAVQQLKFLKGYEKECAERFLLDSNIIREDDVFLLLDGNGKVYARAWNVSEPRWVTIVG